MRKVIKEVGSIFIPVRNLEASINWYQDVLGFELTVNWGLGATLEIENNPTVIGLVQVDEKQEVRFKNKDNLNTPFYNFLTENVHEAYEYLSERNVTVSEIEDNGDFYLLDFQDLDGNLLSIIDLKDNSRWSKER